MNTKSSLLNVASALFGLAVLVIGLINTFWGNDPGFGIFLVLLSLIYFLPVNTILEKITGFKIPRLGMVKTILGVFILWAALGVGELFDKIELMKMDI